MNIWPLRFRDTAGGHLLFTDDAGGFFRGSHKFLERYVEDHPTPEDLRFLRRGGHAFRDPDSLESLDFASRWTRRLHAPGPLSYVILVPTLRCDLDCSYCQVSRVKAHAKGFDWSEETLQAVLTWLGGLECSDIKIEFQGGEPLLRLDILERAREFCRDRFDTSEFVVCTSFQNVSERAWQFFSDPDTHISTSLDGPPEIHTRQRTKSASATKGLIQNLERATREFGTERVSALPTIDPQAPPEPSQLIEAFEYLGLRSIFLRKVNYQGFARKRFDFQSTEAWMDYYRRFVFALIDHNARAAEPLEEYYLSFLLRRILQPGHNGHVDLRNPNWLGKDYLVIDYDGRFYPTDEARMMTRVGQIDLSIGDVSNGLDDAKLDALNSSASNLDDPDCCHCAYQAYCGVDRIDDLSRYGRIDLPRHQTEHCQSHLALFDLAFELLYSEDERVRYSLASWLRLPRFSPKLAPAIG